MGERLGRLERHRATRCRGDPTRRFHVAVLRQRRPPAIFQGGYRIPLRSPKSDVYACSSWPGGQWDAPGHRQSMDDRQPCRSQLQRYRRAAPSSRPKVASTSRFFDYYTGREFIRNLCLRHPLHHHRCAAMLALPASNCYEGHGCTDIDDTGVPATDPHACSHDARSTAHVAAWCTSRAPTALAINLNAGSAKTV